MNISKTIKFFLDLLMKYLGYIGTLVTIGVFVFPNYFESIAQVQKIIISCILIATTIALFNLCKKDFTISMKKNINIEIKEKDIFEIKDGIVVIPVNEFFDTRVADGIICEKSLHGKFIKEHFGGNTEELDEAINDSLSEEEFEEVNGQRSKGKTKSYKIGTVAKVKVKNNGVIYFLLALTKFKEESKKENHRAIFTASNHMMAIAKLFEYIEQNSDGAKINIPLIGTGRGGNLTAEDSLSTILNTIAINENLKLENGIDIIHQYDRKKILNLKIRSKGYEL